MGQLLGMHMKPIFAETTERRIFSSCIRTYRRVYENLSRSSSRINKRLLNPLVNALLFVNMSGGEDGGRSIFEYWKMSEM